MNQAIIFSDNEKYNNLLQQVEFQAQSQGTLITCVISFNKLCQLTAQKIDNIAKNETTILELFELVRFDIEELAETLIKQQDFHPDGKVYLQNI
ncbi:DUF1488 domain-containing protein [Psychromonas sp. RZ22]|uniref:DUF1488 domain-containing protein n=1 Tax=Psychromonas algarum TaxID=2555643 RepID=UPI0010675195|nr:DUF1488 domain-containing protein [Psychromonas sp. RZ22]TEW54120.1 DUF1488 domain-containing protein [Psychromonas sp. RZ22]